MAEATPGPWMSDADGDVVTVGTQNIIALTTESVMLSSSEMEANARLISAAPELLDVLIDLVHLVDDQRQQDSGAYLSFQRAREIIAKATGATPDLIELESE